MTNVQFYFMPPTRRWSWLLCCVWETHDSINVVQIHFLGFGIMIGWGTK